MEQRGREEEGKRGRIKTGTQSAAAFRRLVLAHYTKEGRGGLPWRKRQSPYYVLVSELMLQQTQVDRVVPKFNAFVARFPSWQTLASASLPEVYALWQGLGYNRRAKYLRDAAKLVVVHGTGLTNDEAFIRSLPGVGPYTAGAIRAFAFGNPEPFIETNIRTAVTHHFFPGEGVVHDADILAILWQLTPKRGKAARDWYAALMDYGASLKRQGIKLNHRAKGYTKQSPFKGSLRQVRGAILRELTGGPKTSTQLAKSIARTSADINRALSGLLRDQMIVLQGKRLMIAS